MDNPYSFRIERDDLRLRFMQSRAIHAMAAFFMVLYALEYLANQASWLYPLMLFPPPVMLIFLIVFKRRTLEEVATIRMFRILEIGFLLMGSMHFLQKNHSLVALLFAFVALLVGIVFYMEMHLFNPQHVVFFFNQVEIPTVWGTRKIGWHNIKSVVVRRPYLTVLYPNGNFSQWKIAASNNYEHFDADFASFCNKHCQA